MSVSVNKNREFVDSFYTKPEVAKECVEYFKNIVDFDQFDFIIEPSAGNGSFVNCLEIPRILECGTKLLAFDISPTNLEEQNFLIEKKDFFDWLYKYETLVFEKNTGRFPKICLIGFPPFGNNNSLVKKFIKRACEFSDTIAFIVPKLFKKKEGIFDDFYHKIGELDLKPESFLFDNETQKLPCVFQIWTKKETKRPVFTKEIIMMKYYHFVQKSNVVFKRLAPNAGTFFFGPEHSSLPKETHFFLKFESKKLLEEFKSYSKDIDWNNVVNRNNISKRELVGKLNVFFRSKESLKLN